MVAVHTKNRKPLTTATNNPRLKAPEALMDAVELTLLADAAGFYSRPVAFYLRWGPRFNEHVYIEAPSDLLERCRRKYLDPAGEHTVRLLISDPSASRWQGLYPLMQQRNVLRALGVPIKQLTLFDRDGLNGEAPEYLTSIGYMISQGHLDLRPLASGQRNLIAQTGLRLLPDNELDTGSTAFHFDLSQRGLHLYYFCRVPVCPEQLGSVTRVSGPNRNTGRSVAIVNASEECGDPGWLTHLSIRAAMKLSARLLVLAGLPPDRTEEAARAAAKTCNYTGTILVMVAGRTIKLTDE